MVLHTFQNPAKAKGKEAAVSPTAALDAFLDNQPQTFYESIYRSEAACLCMLR